jgi:rhodanese-related sulfurtransferase
LPPDKPIVVYCYTGHTGQIATTLLSTLGYDATNMKFGMMGWSQDPEVVATAGVFDPATQADYRIEGTLADGESVQGMPGPALIETSEEEVGAFTWTFLTFKLGPVNEVVAATADEAGAINIPWKQLGDPENLAKLPPDKPIVVYCYTGHTGQIGTTLLNAMGYDATNLKFGMMGWSADPEVVATKGVFDPATQADYRIEGALADGGSLEDVPGMPGPALIETSEEEVGAYVWTFLTFQLGPINEVMAATAMEDGTILQLSVSSPEDPELMMDLMMPALEAFEGQ